MRSSSAFARLEEELLGKARGGRPSLLDEYKPQLHQRWNEGRTTSGAARRDHGARIPRLLRHSPRLRGAVPDLGAAPPATSAPPKVRDVVRWLLREPGSHLDDEKLKLKHVTGRCPHLKAHTEYIAEFATMLTGRHGDRLDAWMAAADDSGFPGLRSFLTWLRRDYDGVPNGLTLPWSSGAVKGNVNRLKILKRQMYGRASPDLLRRRILPC